ncbi:MAG: pyruvate ferredoxin oxidoreductase [Candidatus Wolframiiraptor sp.]|nr:MAG: pyruvate ferredoxin oxidoreductase [Candidatus Wolframiiraptor sp.]
MTRVELKFIGFGGQGIGLLGRIVGKAAALYDNKHSVFTQVYGPEARGGASYSCVVIDNEPIDYPYTQRPDVMVIMSQEGAHKFLDELKEDGILIIDSDLVEIPESILRTIKLYGIPATKIAESLGARVVANIVMLGFFTRITKLISYEAARKAVTTTVPSKYLELNLRAFEEGYHFKEKEVIQSA